MCGYGEFQQSATLAISLILFSKSPSGYAAEFESVACGYCALEMADGVIEANLTLDGCADGFEAAFLAQLRSQGMRRFSRKRVGIGAPSHIDGKRCITGRNPAIRCWHFECTTT